MGEKRKKKKVLLSGSDRVLAQKKKKRNGKGGSKKIFLRFARRDYAAPPKIKKVRMDFQHVQF